MRPDKPSATARLVAASTVYLHHDRRLGFLVPADWARFCGWFIRAYSMGGPLLMKLLPWAWFRWLASFLERFGVPGIIPHYVLRKRAIDDLTTDALLFGARQVVVLGAGFDTLALRRAGEKPGVRFFELDHPATQKVKARALEENGGTPPNLHLISADFAKDSWLNRLRGHPAFDAAAPTLVIIEGVLMYLTEDQVRETLMTACQSTTGPVTVVFTFMETRRDGSYRFRNSSGLVDAWLRLRREEFLWGIRPGDLPSFLATCGLRFERLITTVDFRQTYLNGVPVDGLELAEGESLCLALKREGA